jgi:hypothetical protein
MAPAGAIYSGRGISLKCSRFQVDLNRSSPAPTISKLAPGDRALALRTNSWVGDRDCCSSIQASLLAVQLEHDLALEDDVQLLLSAAPLVVLLDECLISTRRHEEVGSEGVDPERVLKRIPGRIVRATV